MIAADIEANPQISRSVCNRFKYLITGDVAAGGDPGRDGSAVTGWDWNSWFGI